MKLSARMTASAALLLTLAGTVGCTKLKARDQLVRGVQAFKSGKYEEAVDYFQKSVALDPTNPIRPPLSRYRSTAIRSFPISPRPRIWPSRRRPSTASTQCSPRTPTISTPSARSPPSIATSTSYDQAKATELKIISLDPNDAEANYTIGYIDWTESYKNATDILAAAGLQDDGLGNVKKSKAVCEKLVAANTDLVNECAEVSGACSRDQSHLRQRNVDPEPHLSA